MKNIYLFDVEGTLTPRAAVMPTEMASEFIEFAAKFPTYIASSSTYDNLRKRLPAKVLRAAKGIYCCSGAELYQNGVNVYRRNHAFSKFLTSACDLFIKDSGFRYKSDNHIQRRPGVLNVSIVGHGADRAEKIRYIVWDRATGERERFARYLNESPLEYEAYLSGNISIDIMPNSKNKAMIADDLFERCPSTRITFFGDRIAELGNDLPLAQRLRESDINHRVISVGNHKHTSHHMKRLIAKSAQMAG